MIDLSKYAQMRVAHVDYDCSKCNDIGILSNNSLCQCEKGKTIFKKAMQESGIKAKYALAKFADLSGQVGDFFGKMDVEDTFYLFGTVGVGKTYAASAFIKRLIWTKYRFKAGEHMDHIIYHRHSYLLLDFREFYDKEFDSKIAENVDYLIIDDLFAQFNPTSFSMDHVLPLFERLIERRINKNLKNSFISNVKLEKIIKIAGARINSRIHEMVKHIGEINDKDRRIGEVEA